jgi:hypothetical protein
MSEIGIYRQLQWPCSVFWKMTDQQSKSPAPRLRAKSARRFVEIIAAAAFLGLALYWPSTHTGRIHLAALGVVLLVGLFVLRSGRRSEALTVK